MGNINKLSKFHAKKNKEQSRQGSFLRLCSLAALRETFIDILNLMHFPNRPSQYPLIKPLTHFVLRMISLFSLLQAGTT
jgi:hypothetical protein